MYLWPLGAESGEVPLDEADIKRIGFSAQQVPDGECCGPYTSWLLLPTPDPRKSQKLKRNRVEKLAFVPPGEFLQL